MIFLDAAYLLALAMPTDAMHHRALAWSRSAQEAMLTTQFVLTEFVNVLSKPHARWRAHALLASIMSDRLTEIVPLSPDLFQRGLEFHRERIDKGWSLVDCVSFLIMSDNNCHAALTFDHHFEQAGFQALMRRDP